MKDILKAEKLLREAKGAILEELGVMSEEEQSQPIPKAHGKLVDRIEKFLRREILQ